MEAKCAAVASLESSAMPHCPPERTFVASVLLPKIVAPDSRPGFPASCLSNKPDLTGGDSKKRTGKLLRKPGKAEFYWKSVTNFDVFTHVFAHVFQRISLKSLTINSLP